MTAKQNRPIYQLLSQARKERGLTQSELASKVGCKQSAISMMERGSEAALSLSTIEVISKELGVDVSAFSADVSAPSQAKGKTYCPIYDCPANTPYSVNGVLYALPRSADDATSHCRYCGELMESQCPGCGATVDDGSCCHTCGTAYIATPETIPAGAEAWAQAQRTRLKELGIQ